MELDFVRRSIVSAFVAALPTIFKEKDMMVDCDGTSKVYAWSIFERKLSDHFYSYHRMVEYEAKPCLYQCQPLPLHADGSPKVLTVPSDISIDINFLVFRLMMMNSKKFV